jgi:hypothetical protein
MPTYIHSKNLDMTRFFKNVMIGSQGNPSFFYDGFPKAFNNGLLSVIN